MFYLFVRVIIGSLVLCLNVCYRLRLWDLRTRGWKAYRPASGYYMIFGEKFVLIIVYFKLME